MAIKEITREEFYTLHPDHEVNIIKGIVEDPDTKYFKTEVSKKLKAIRRVVVLETEVISMEVYVFDEYRAEAKAIIEEGMSYMMKNFPDKTYKMFKVKDRVIDLLMTKPKFSLEKIDRFFMSAKPL